MQQGAFRLGSGDETSASLGVFQRGGIGLFPAQAPKRTEARSRIQYYVLAAELDHHGTGIKLAEPQYDLVKRTVLPVRHSKHCGLKAGGAGKGRKRYVDLPCSAIAPLQDFLDI